MTVLELRKQGYQVRVRHQRAVTYYPKLNGEITWLDHPVPKERGGCTVVELTKDDKTVTGLAVCSDNDNYNKKIGVKIAIGRALASLQDGKNHNPENTTKNFEYWPQPLQWRTATCGSFVSSQHTD